MSEADGQRYCRMMKFLMKGGTKMTRKLFEKRVQELENINPDPMTPWSVDTFLNLKKKRILDSKKGREKENVYFPGVCDKTNLESWDLIMFCFILTRVCDMSNSITKDIEELRDMRNELCHMGEPCLNKNAYKKKLRNAEVIADNICKEINDTNFEREIKDFIKNLDTEDFTVHEVLKLSHNFYQRDREAKAVLTEVSKDTKEILRRIGGLETMYNSKESTDAAGVKLPETDVEIVVQNCNKDKEKKLSELLVKLIDEQIHKETSLAEEVSNENMSELRKAVAQAVEIFLANGRKITSTEMKCILVRVQATSIGNLVKLFLDCISGELTDQLKPLERAVRKIPGFEDISLEAIIYEDEFRKVMWKTVSMLEEYMKSETSRPRASVSQCASSNAAEGTSLELSIQYRTATQHDLFRDAYERGEVDRHMKNIQDAAGPEYSDVMIKARLKTNKIAFSPKVSMLEEYMKAETSRPRASVSQCASSNAAQGTSLELSIRYRIATQHDSFRDAYERGGVDRHMKNIQDAAGPENTDVMTKARLKTNKIAISPKAKKMRQCPDCKSLGFGSRGELINHRRMTHGTAKCDCGRTFLKEEYMVQHRRVSRKHGSNNVQDYGSSGLASKGARRRHRRQTHGSVMCDCGRAFLKEKHMTQHREENRRHNPGRAFPSLLDASGISRALGSLHLSVDLYDQKSEDIWSFIANNVQADTHYLGCCGEVINMLVRKLHKLEVTPRRIIKSGSLGKGTAVKGRSNIDIVLMLAHYTDVRKLMSDMPTILKTLRDYLDNNTEAVTKKPTRFSVPAEVTCSSGHKHDVDILPAVDLLELGNSPEEVYRQMRGQPSDMILEFSVSLAPLQLEIIGHLPTKVKDLIKLVKYWKDTKLKGQGQPELQRFSERYAGDPKWPSCYSLELVVMATWVQAGRPVVFSMPKAVHAVLTSLVNHSSMQITFPGIMTYCADMIKRRSPPYIMDPANPYNDVYHGLVDGKPFDWPNVVPEALRWLSKPLFNGIGATEFNWNK